MHWPVLNYGFNHLQPLAIHVLVYTGLISKITNNFGMVDCVNIEGSEVPNKIVYLSRKIVLVLANSVDPNEMTYYVAFRLGLHYSPKWECSGSVVECLTRDRRAAGSSLTGVTALWSLSKTHLS